MSQLQIENGRRNKQTKNNVQLFHFNLNSQTPPRFTSHCLYLLWLSMFCPRLGSMLIYLSLINLSNWWNWTILWIWKRFQHNYIVFILKMKKKKQRANAFFLAENNICNQMFNYRLQPTLWTKGVLCACVRACVHVVLLLLLLCYRFIYELKILFCLPI